MNRLLLKAVIIKNGDTQGSLAKALKLPQSAVSMRLKGMTDFRLSEINCIRQRYKLTNDETMDIFFDEEVS